MARARRAVPLALGALCLVSAACAPGGPANSGHAEPQVADAEEVRLIQELLSELAVWEERGRSGATPTSGYGQSGDLSDLHVTLEFYPQTAAEQAYVSVLLANSEVVIPQGATVVRFRRVATATVTPAGAVPGDPGNPGGSYRTGSGDDFLAVVVTLTTGELRVADLRWIVRGDPTGPPPMGWDGPVVRAPSDLLPPEAQAEHVIG